MKTWRAHSQENLSSEQQFGGQTISSGAFNSLQQAGRGAFHSYAVKQEAVIWAAARKVAAAKEAKAAKKAAAEKADWEAFDAYMSDSDTDSARDPDYEVEMSGKRKKAAPKAGKSRSIRSRNR